MLRSRLLYLFLLVLSFVFVYNYGGIIPYTFFYLTLLLPAVSLVHLLSSLLFLRCGQKLDRDCAVKGESVLFTISLSNRFIFYYPCVRIFFGGSDAIFSGNTQSIVLPAHPLHTGQHTLKLLCRYRGIYQASVTQVQFEDFLGIFRFTVRGFTPLEILVYPRILENEVLQVESTRQSDSRAQLNPLNEDMTTISDIRKYSYGDSIKRIHWKLTARTREMMVKRYEGTLESNTLLLLDLRKNFFSPLINLMLEDRIIEVFVSVLHACSSGQIPVRVMLANSGLSSIDVDSLSAFENMRHMLASILFDQEISGGDLVEASILDAEGSSSVLLFTANLDYTLSGSLVKAQASGHDMYLFYISPAAEGSKPDPQIPDMLDQLRRQGITVVYNDIK